MSDKVLHLRVVTPDRLVADIPVKAVGAFGTEGAFTALPGHVPFLTEMQPGLLWYRTPDENTRDLAVSGGFIEILPDKALVLADSAEYVEEIDVERAERARERAEKRLADAKMLARSSQDPGKDVNADLARAEISLRKATTRVKMAHRKAAGGR